MATYTDWITKCGSFNIAEKKAIVNAFRDSGGGDLTPTAAPVALTDQTLGTANNTISAVTNVVAGTGDVDASDLNPILDDINDNFADLALKVNQMRTALIASGILT